MAAVCFGAFDKCDPAPGAGYTLDDVLLDAVVGLGVPVLGRLPGGHGKRNRTLVWGATAHVDGSRLVVP